MAHPQNVGQHKVPFPAVQGVLAQGHKPCPALSILLPCHIEKQIRSLPISHLLSLMPESKDRRFCPFCSEKWSCHLGLPLQRPCGVCKNEVLEELKGKTFREMDFRVMSPYPCPHQQIPGSRWEWEGVGRRKPVAPARDGLFEQTKSSGLFPPAPTQWKEFPAPAPGWKS